MTDDQLLQLLASANPMPAARAASLPLAEAQNDLLVAVLVADAPPAPRWQARRRRLFPRVGLAFAAAAAVVAVFALAGGSGRHGSGTAWAAGQVRFAQASPLVLLGAPGWRVEYADEQSSQEGELHFRIGPAPPSQNTVVNGDTATVPVPADTTAAQLNWYGGTLDDREPHADFVFSTTGPVLGTIAHIYQYPGGTPGHRDITALFTYDGSVLEFRAGAADVAAFKVLLATLTRVDTDAWLSAMPASAIKVTDRATVIAGMLEGVTVPPGFQATDVKGPDLVKDRYQLGAAVSGTVACEWIKRWADARTAHDAATEQAAVAAMATAKDWPILKEMAASGDYPTVLEDYAAAMPSGKWYGRPLIGDVKEGLGCDGFGVTLP